MKFAIKTTAALLLTTAAAQAGGIERYNQGLAPLFEPGNYAEIGFGMVKPTIEGTDVATFQTQNVADNYNQFGLAYKHQFNEQLSAMVMFNQPFGADIYYPTAAEGGSVVLGGTAATVSSHHLTGVLRYKMPNNFAVHGGFNVSRADAEVSLAGAAYATLPGGSYNVKMDKDTAVGWLGGVSWEKPEIAARVSLTYHSAITHKFDTVESFAPTLVSTTEVETPESWTLDFQTGVAADTLVFGSIRWVNWSDFKVKPQLLGRDLVDLDDSTTYTLGVGRKFNDQWSGAASISWEKKGDDGVSPLAPSRGKMGLTLAGIYTQDNMKITTGINYTKVGDATATVADNPVAKMEGNSAWGVGVRVGFSF